MKRKKILWLCSWYPSIGEPFNGDFIQRHARAASLFNDIYVIHVYGYSSGKKQELKTGVFHNDGLTEKIIYYRKSKSFTGRIIASITEIRIVRKEIKEYFQKFGKPDLVHVHIPYKLGLAAIWMKNRYGLSFIVTEHWGIYNLGVEDNFISRPYYFKNLIQKVFKNASRTLSVSHFLGEGISRFVLEKKYDVIPNVVDTDLFFLKDKGQGRFRFIHVSNMVPLKNAEGILKAFQTFIKEGNDAELIMVGDTNPDIRLFAENLGFPTGVVAFRGEITYKQVAIEMQNSDCLLLFSKMENSPCVIGEALCCGLPVIATEVGGIPELLNSENSILIAPGDEQALALAMKSMSQKEMDFNQHEIAEIARNKFNYEVIGKKLNTVYAEVLAGDY